MTPTYKDNRKLRFGKVVEVLMRTVLAGVLVAGGLLAGGLPAFADTISIPETGVVNETAGKSFTYDFSYTVPAGGISIDGVAGSSSSTTKSKGTILNLSFSSVAIYDGSSTTPIFTSMFAAPDPKTPGSGTHSFSLPTGGIVVASGDVIDVRYMGSVLKGQPGAFNGNLSVSSVPLPTSVALMGTALLGLGVAGAAMRKSAAKA